MNGFREDKPEVDPAGMIGAAVNRGVDGVLARDFAGEVCHHQDVV